MRIGARNVPRGRVKRITPGAMNTEVAIELPGGTETVSIITRASADRLKLAHGTRGLCRHQGLQPMIVLD